MASPVNIQKLVRSIAVHECTSTLAGCTRCKAISFQLPRSHPAKDQEPLFLSELDEKLLLIKGKVRSSILQNQSLKNAVEILIMEKEILRYFSYWNCSILQWIVVLAPITKVIHSWHKAWQTFLSQCRYADLWQQSS